MTNLNEYRNIWVYIETECGKAKNVGFELLNAARPLAEQKGCELVAVVMVIVLRVLQEMPSAMARTGRS